MLTIARGMGSQSSVHGDLQEGFERWRSAMRWQRLLDAALSEIGLTHTQYLVLSSAAEEEREQGDAVKQCDIATRAGLDPATTSRLVAGLTRRGLLDRGPTHGDRRAWRVVVSASGGRLLARARPIARASAREFFARGR